MAKPARGSRSSVYLTRAGYTCSPRAESQGTLHASTAAQVWARLAQLRAMRCARECLLMKLGSAQRKAPAAWRLTFALPSSLLLELVLPLLLCALQLDLA